MVTQCNSFALVRYANVNFWELYSNLILTNAYELILRTWLMLHWSFTMIIKKWIWLDTGERRSRKDDHYEVVNFHFNFALPVPYHSLTVLETSKWRCPSVALGLLSHTVWVLTCTTGNLRSYLSSDPLNAALTRSINPNSFAAWATTW